MEQHRGTVQLSNGNNPEVNGDILNPISLIQLDYTYPPLSLLSVNIAAKKKSCVVCYPNAFNSASLLEEGAEDRSFSILPWGRGPGVRQRVRTLLLHPFLIALGSLLVDPIKMLQVQFLFFQQCKREVSHGGHPFNAVVGWVGR